MNDAGNITSIISIPVISALIGWGTNYLAVKMIFRPKNPINFLGFKLHGLIPKRQKELAINVAETIHDKLFSLDDITGSLTPEDLSRKFFPIVQKVVDDLLQNKISQIPVVGAFLQGDLLNKVRDMLVTEVVKFTPEFVSALGEGLEERVDVKKIIQSRIESFDIATLEGIIYKISSRELKTIEILGGVLGFLVGIVQVGILLLT